MRPLKFSKKQRRVLTWWRPSSPDSGYDAILCEGAVRSGKTLCTGLSFFCWAMTCFAQKSFALCGKSVPAVRRNLWQELRPILREMGFQIRERLSQNRIDVSLGRRRNTFYLFGGLDERSAALVQGITLAGALLDEAALMPRSFVEQVCARCSVEGSRLWFSCNPESPAHWFYQEWVQKAREKNVLRLSFTMEDNPGLSRETIRRYEAMFQGAFYRRFILGEWAQAEGLVYDFFGPELVREAPEGLGGPWYISCDYGTVNPTSMGLWGRKGGVWYRAAAFYYDSRRERRQKGGVLLRLPEGAAAENRRGVRPGPGRAGRRTEHPGGGGGPLRRQLSGAAPAAGVAGGPGQKRRALRHPHHGGAAAGGKNRHLLPLPGRHPGVRTVLLGHLRHRRRSGGQIQ